MVGVCLHFLCWAACRGLKHKKNALHVVVVQGMLCRLTVAYQCALWLLMCTSLSV